MKQLLVVSYYFPPMGLGGTQRIAKFVKYLPQFGWQPTVLTVKPIAYWAWDESLQADVQGAEIVRCESLDPQRLMARFGKHTLSAAPSREQKTSLVAFLNNKLLPYVLQPDSKMLWKPFALRAAKQMLRHRTYDALLTTSPPHSVHVVGRGIKKHSQLKWVADFRDSWAGSHVVQEPTSWHYKRNVAKQNQVVQEADAVISASIGIHESLLSENVDRDKFHIITNGFDPQEVRPIRSKHREFTLCYSGTINKFASPIPFLDALILLREQAAPLYETLRVQFVGLDTLGDFKEWVRERKLLEKIEILGHLTHAESVKYVNRADGLLLIAKARETDTFIPGKTFEYIGAQKPIFSVSSSKYTNELLADYALAITADSQEPQLIFNKLTEFLQTDWNCINNDSDFVQQFNRIHQTRQLAEILNHLTKK